MADETPLTGTGHNIRLASLESERVPIRSRTALWNSDTHSTLVGNLSAVSLVRQGANLRFRPVPVRRGGSVRPNLLQPRVPVRRADPSAGVLALATQFQLESAAPILSGYLALGSYYRVWDRSSKMPLRGEKYSISAKFHCPQ